MPQAWPPQPIATRTLQWDDGSDRHDVLLRFWPPVELHDGGPAASVCDFAIDGLPDPVRLSAPGLDSLGAILMALIWTRDLLKPYRDKLVYLDERGEHGLPMQVLSFVDSADTRQLERILELEIERTCAVLGAPNERRLARIAKKLGIPPLLPLGDLSVEELFALLLDTVRAERTSESDGVEDSVMFFMTRQNEIIEHMGKRGDLEHVLGRYRDAADPLVAYWAARLTLNHPKATETFRRLRDAGTLPEGDVLAKAVLEPRVDPRPKPWD